VSWIAGLSSSAIRDLDRIPPRVVPAVLEFIYGPLTENPRRVGKPLRDDFAGEWSARRGSYRILYRLDDVRTPTADDDTDAAPGVAFGAREGGGQC